MTSVRTRTLPSEMAMAEALCPPRGRRGPAVCSQLGRSAPIPAGLAAVSGLILALGLLALILGSLGPRRARRRRRTRPHAAK